MIIINLWHYRFPKGDVSERTCISTTPKAALFLKKFNFLLFKVGKLQVWSPTVGYIVR